MTTTPIADPIPAKITTSGLEVGITNFQLIQPSDAAAPLARISVMREAPDDSDRLFVNDLRGSLWVIDGGTTVEYADLSDIFANFVDEPGRGTGFASFAFHPEFASNGIFYTTHTETLGSGTTDFPVINGFYRPTALEGVITEWTASDPTSNSWAGTNREVVRVDLPGHFHGIQEITFNPHAAPGDTDYGLLYIGIGDGGQFQIGTGGDASHRLDSLLGTVVRIDPMGTNAANGAYGIPADNPYASDGDPATLDEIYAWGFRNPHRFAFDDVTGKVIIGEIGQDNIEELNLLVPGADYGWFLREGTFAVDALDASLIYDLPPDDAGFTYPVAMYDHDEGIAIAGGYVYRGTAIPELQGQYVFADLVTGRMFHVPVDELVQGSMAEIRELTLVTSSGQTTRLKQLIGANRADVRFGIDDEGEIYLLTKTDGMIRKLVSPDGNPGGGGGVDTSGFDFVDNLTPQADSFDADASGRVGTNFVDAQGGSDTVLTGTGNDEVLGGDGDDSIDAGDGDDTVDAGSGNDTGLAGNGNDDMRGGFGDDMLLGGSGADTLLGEAGSDTLDGGSGPDSLDGGDDPDWITGGPDNDTIDGGPGNDRIDGDDGNDEISAQSGRDQVGGGSGDDSILGGSGNDTLTGEDGLDTILGGNGGDLIDGGADADSLTGGNAADTLMGGDGDDFAHGEGFKDLVSGGAGDDSLYGGGQADTLNGDAGADKLYGGVGKDVIHGGADNDFVHGGKGNDRLNGGTGDDTLFGSAGNDQLFGDAGADAFRFNANHGTLDRIMDFELGLDTVEFNIAALSDISDLSLTDVFMGVDIDYGSGVIRVMGVSTSDLSASDFAFL